MSPLDLEAETNPLLVADEIGFFLSDGLRDGSVSLRSAFYLNQEALRIRRRAYHQPAWGYTLSISGLLAVYMQRLVALATGEKVISQQLANWLKEDAPLLKERRAHYLAQHILANPVADPSAHLLAEMSRIRQQYELLSDDDGPYHVEVFPYEYYSPEDILCSGPNPQPFEALALEPAVEALLVSVGIGKWG
jgi:hypothetical protein